MMTRIPINEFKQNAELLILTTYFPNAAVVWFSPNMQRATIKKTPASRRRFQCCHHPHQCANRAIRMMMGMGIPINHKRIERMGSSDSE
jgi:hypothetical protein